MRTIKIAGKIYPFIVSAANAKANAELAIDAAKNKSEIKIASMIDHYTNMIYMGLKDGQLTIPFWKRKIIPSRKRLQRLIPFDEMSAIVNDESTPKSTDKEENSEKK